MHYKLLGFTQDGSVRRYTFHRIEAGAAPVVFVVLADTAVARRHNVGIQELPSLCSTALGACGTDGPSQILLLTEEEIHQCGTSNTAAAAQTEAARQLRSRYLRARRIENTAGGTSPGSHNGGPIVESLVELKHRFTTAFRMFSCRDAALRGAGSPPAEGSREVQPLSIERQKLLDAEREYRSVRLEYVNRLLSLSHNSERHNS